MDHQELVAWVEATLGGRVVHFEHNTAGSSRQTYMVKVEGADGGQTGAVVRHDIGTGPFSGTAFTLTRESGLLQALEGRGLMAPRCLRLSEDGNTELLEWLPGTATIEFPGPNEQLEVGSEFVDLISRLHAIGPDDLELPHCPRPDGPRDHALNDLAQWEEFVTRRRLDEVAPALLVASSWLRAHAPVSTDTVLVHGDCGPGNFLHDGRHLTGILDWELSHWGDPMDDLAWWWFREALHPVRTDLATWYRLYGERTGRTVDRDRILYYRAFVLYRCAIATVADPVLVEHSWIMVARMAKALQQLGVSAKELTVAADRSEDPLEPLAI
jgi:aminoglycoside phosphotransferase (APT) family kinase protein